MPSAIKFRKYHLVAAIAIAGSSGLGLYAQQTAPSQNTVANAGWVSLFNDASLDGWDGRRDVWKVEGGTIAGEVAAGPSSVSDTTYIFWKGGEPSDFDFKAEIKTDGPFVNSGVVYRGFVQPPPPGRGGGGPGLSNAPYKLGGPQLDFDAADRYSGQYFEIGTDRGLLARRGQIVETNGSGQPQVIGALGDDKMMGSYVKRGDWNQLRIIAHGNTVIHMINGHVVAVLVDNDPAKFRAHGLLAFQLEGAGKVQFRNIWLKTD